MAIIRYGDVSFCCNCVIWLIKILVYFGNLFCNEIVNILLNYNMIYDRRYNFWRDFGVISFKYFKFNGHAVCDHVSGTCDCATKLCFSLQKLYTTDIQNNNLCRVLNNFFYAFRGTISPISRRVCQLLSIARIKLHIVSDVC